MPWNMLNPFEGNISFPLLAGTLPYVQTFLKGNFGKKWIARKSQKIGRMGVSAEIGNIWQIYFYFSILRRGGRVPSVFEKLIAANII